MSDLEPLERLRPCGRLEMYSTARHDLGFYNNVACTAYYSLPDAAHDEGLSVEKLVFAALRKVIDTHPILSAIPLDEDTTNAYFARLPSIDLRKCVTFVVRKEQLDESNPKGCDAEIDEILAAQHNKNFKSELGTLPFWRLIVLSLPTSPKSFAAMWAFHHAIGDGTSGLAFHRTFLSVLQTLSPHDADLDSTIVACPNTPLLPTLESLHPLPLSLSFLAKAQWSDWFPSRQRTLWTGGKIRNDEAYKESKIRTVQFPRETTSRLLLLSRENKTSLTATLETLLAAVVFSHLPESTVDRIVSNGVISLRRFLPSNVVDDNKIGVWVTGYEFEHRRPKADSTEFSWSEARQVRQRIADELAKRGSNATSALLRWVSDIPKWFLEKDGMERGDTFEVSNLGVYKPGPAQSGDRGWNIGKMVFSQCGSVAGSGFSVSIVTGGDGCMTLAFSWLEGIVEGVWIEKVIDSTCERIDDLAKQ